MRKQPREQEPPPNFSMVWAGVYRSAFPVQKNFGFLKQLRLRSVVYLCPEEYPETNSRFLDEEGITLRHFGMTGNKEPFEEIPEPMIRRALAVVLDRANHPVLIHCNQGKHRTGCVVGCIRRAQRWSLISIFEEYRRFAGDKSRVVDQQFIERFSLAPPPAAAALPSAPLTPPSTRTPPPRSPCGPLAQDEGARLLLSPSIQAFSALSPARSPRATLADERSKATKSHPSAHAAQAQAQAAVQTAQAHAQANSTDT